MNKFNREIDYYVSSSLHLSLEDFSNAGLTQDEMQTAIEQYGERNRTILSVMRAGINSNLIVETQCNNSEFLQWLVNEIYDVLENLLELKKP